MPSTVYFASARAARLEPQATLPAKFQRLLARHSLPDLVKDKSVAIKIHVGGEIGYTTIHPLFVSLLAQAVKEAGGRPFVTDGSSSIPNARARGYTEEVVGCPIVPAAGFNEKYVYTREVNVKTLKKVVVAGEIADVDFLIDFSHVKGHGTCAYGGACKNLAMGCVARPTRWAIHGLEGGLEWHEELCRHCDMCVEACPTGAASFTEEGRFTINYHDCGYCQHCAVACPEDAITLDPKGYHDFQKGMAAATREVLSFFQRQEVLYINMLLNVTMVCDCWGMSTPNIVPDIGILSSQDIVAIEKASLDLIKLEDFLPGGLPKDRTLHEKGTHLFERIHGKDPFLQVRLLDAEGLGTQHYQLVEVE